VLLGEPLRGRVERPVYEALFQHVLVPAGFDGRGGCDVLIRVCLVSDEPAGRPATQIAERSITDVADTKNGVTKTGSDSENPGIPSPTPKVTRPRTINDWWPERLDLSVLHHNSPLSNPMGEDFNYADEFKSLDLEALKADLIELMTTSQS
jgi:hypothetical protein